MNLMFLVSIKNEVVSICLCGNLMFLVDFGSIYAWEVKSYKLLLCCRDMLSIAGINGGLNYFSCCSSFI